MTIKPDEKTEKKETMAEKLLREHEGWKDSDYQRVYGDMWQYMKDQDEFLRLSPEDQKKVRDAQALALADNKKALARIKAYIKLPQVQEQLAVILGDAQKGAVYAESVAIAVAANPDLQKASPRSIMIQALRAASLRLSVDPIMQQAHLVRFGEDVTLIPDYHGLVSMSEKTNYYSEAPYVGEVYEGETVNKNRNTGEITISGEKVSDKIIGWRAHFKAKNGVEHWLYMTNEQCDKHAETYNPTGFKHPKSPWNDHGGRNRDKMRRKTCLRIFIKMYGNFDPVMEEFLRPDAEEFKPSPDFIDLPSDDIEVVEETLPAEGREERVKGHLKALGFE